MKVLSIDVGIKNLAFCLLEKTESGSNYKIVKWDSINVADIETNKDLYRPMLQAYGEYCRNRKGKDKSGVEYGKDYWCIVTFREIVKSSADIVIITDVRYPEECEWIKRSGGIVVRICRETGLKDEHVSETSLDTYNNFDHIILNTGDLGHLFQDVKDLVVKLKIKIK